MEKVHKFVDVITSAKVNNVLVMEYIMMSSVIMLSTRTNLDDPEHSELHVLWTNQDILISLTAEPPSKKRTK